MTGQAPLVAPLVAGVELGGTKCIAVLARDRQIIARNRWPTGDDPAATLGTVSGWLAAVSRDEPFAALGIGSFGPLCLDVADPRYGYILNTPKPGWSGTDVIGRLAAGFDVPVGFDTDVAGAALAEGLWGASVGCSSHVYLTIGTGIGGGVVIDGKPLHGAVHPELGHIRVRRQTGDHFAGTCPFHRDCLEGLASGPAIAARAGKPAEALDDNDPVWHLIAHEIAELMSTLILTLSPQRIVIGGGVGQGQPALLPLIHAATARLLCGYLPGQSEAELREIIVHPAMGEDAGVFGAIALANAALERCGV